MSADAWQAVFTINAGPVVGFDVRKGGYAERSDADYTNRRVPWSQTQRVVSQGNGNNPDQRDYKGLVYDTEQFSILHAQLGKTGSLVVGSPVVRQTPVICKLMTIQLETINDDGSVQFSAGFIVYGPG